jgi:hypothetical protein
VTVLQARSATVGSGSSSISISSANMTPATPGSVWTVKVMIPINTRTASIVSQNGEVWTPLAGQPVTPASQTSLRTYAWRCETGATPFTQIVVNIGGGSVTLAHLVAIETDGVDVTPNSNPTPFSGTSQSDPLDVGGITTSRDNCLLVGIIVKESSSDSWSAPATAGGWTVAGNTTSRIQTLYRIAETAGTYPCTVNWSGTASRHVTADFVAYPMDEVVVPAGGENQYIGGMW